jgi:hypothetical protein
LEARSSRRSTAKSETGSFPIGRGYVDLLNTTLERWHFERDNRGNELGNLLAAVDPTKYLAPESGAELGDVRLREALYVYYQAFGDGWTPTLWTKEEPLDPARLACISETYRSLERVRLPFQQHEPLTPGRHR